MRCISLAVSTLFRKGLQTHTQIQYDDVMQQIHLQLDTPACQGDCVQAVHVVLLLNTAEQNSIEVASLEQLTASLLMMYDVRLPVCEPMESN